MNKSVHLIILNIGQEEVLMRKMCLVAVFSTLIYSLRMDVLPSATAQGYAWWNQTKIISIPSKSR